MTGLLEDLMHQRADALGAPELDLGEITRAGERRVRRRRTALVGGVAAAAVVAAVTVPGLLGGDDGTRSDRVADGTDAAPVTLSWVTGSTLHREGRPEVDLGADVRAWLWAGDAVVFTDADRRVHVWRDGTDEVVGTAADPGDDVAELVGDTRLAAWVGDDGRMYAVDLGPTATSPLPVAQGGRVERVTAVDGERVYAVAPRGVVAWDVLAGTEQVLDADRGSIVLDAEDGVLVRSSGSREATVTGPGRELTLTTDGFANLSPDGAFVTAESDDAGLMLDTATGRELPVDSGHEWFLPYQWLDDDTVVVLALDGIERAEGTPEAFLQSCAVPTGACDGPGAGLPGAFGSFQLPIGIHFSD